MKNKRPIIIDGDTCRIQLKDGAFAICDLIDLPKVEGHSWHRMVKRYAGTRINARVVLMHRLICSGDEIDHINGDGLDNRRANLRACSHAENVRNQRPRGGRQYKGVVSRTTPGNKAKPYSAQITINAKSRSIGCFATAEEAARAYDIKAIELFGQFARTNFPKQQEESNP